MENLTILEQTLLNELESKEKQESERIRLLQEILVQLLISTDNHMQLRETLENFQDELLEQATLQEQLQTSLANLSEQLQGVVKSQESLWEELEASS